MGLSILSTLAALTQVTLSILSLVETLAALGSDADAYCGFDVARQCANYSDQDTDVYRCSVGYRGYQCTTLLQQVWLP